MAASAATSGLTLETYLQLYKALTKDKTTVQSVTPIEESFYKMGDLKQLLHLHGISCGKFNRYEVLQALKGKALVNPISIRDSFSTATGPTTLQQEEAEHGIKDSSGKQRLFSPADLICLGWAEEGEDMLSAPMEQLQLSFDSELEAEAACSAYKSRQAATQHITAPPQHLLAVAQVAPPPTVVQKVAKADESVEHPTLQAPTAQALTGCSKHLVAVATIAAVDIQTHKGVLSDRFAHAAPPLLHTPHAAAAQALPLQQQQYQVRHVVGAATAGPVKQADSVRAEPLLPTCAISQQVQATALGMVSISTQQPQIAVQTLHDSFAHTSQQQQQQQQQCQQQLAAQRHPESNKQLGRPAAATAATGAPPPQDSSSNKDLICMRLQQAGLQSGCPLPSHCHAQWLLQQLQRFVAAGAAASREKLPAAGRAADAGDGLPSAPGSAGGVLLGRGVGFVLMEEMQVAGPKNTMLMLPAGVFEGRVVKHLGSNCQPELCEKACLGGHQFYRARVIPPQLPDEENLGPSATALAAEHAAFVDQAHAAITGRPVLLILDLHPRLRCNTFKTLLQLNASKLQDAWVLLVPPSQTKEDRPAEESKQVASSTAHTHSRKGRPGGSSQQQPNKRTRV